MKLVHAGASLVAMALPLCAALAADPGAGGKPVVIGVSLPVLDYPLYVETKKAAEAEAAALDVKVEVTDARWSADKQRMDLEAFVDQRLNGVVYAPVPMAALEEALDEAAAAGIPVVMVGGGKRPEKVLAAFKVDDVAGGRMAARLVAQHLGGKGDAVWLGAIGPFWDDYLAAFTAELRTTQVKLQVLEPVEIFRGKAEKAVAALLNGGRRFDAIVTVNDALALGAADALRAAGIDPGSKVILGLDAVPEARRAVQEGVLTATFDPRPGDQVREALRCLVTHLRTGKAPPARDVALPAQVVTRAAQD